MSTATHPGGARGPRRVRPPPHRARPGAVDGHAVHDRRGGPRRAARRRRPRLHPHREPSTCPSGRTEVEVLTALRELAGRNEVATLAHRHGVLRHVHAAGHPAQRAREPGLVHGVHALPARDQPGPARGAAQLPDDGRPTSPAWTWPTPRCSTRPRRPPRRWRCAGGCRRARATRSSSTRTPIPRRSPSCDTGRADRHRPRGRASPRTDDDRLLRRALLSYPGASGPRRPVEPLAAHAHGAGGASSPPTCSRSSCWRRPASGRRHRRRLGPALRRADGLRRPARRLPRHPRRLRPLAARRLVGVSTDADGRPRCASRSRPRAAHPPGEGDLEHLHRPGAAGQHRRHVRGVARTRGSAPHRRAGPPPDDASWPPASRAAARGRQRHLVRHPAACVPGRARRDPRRARRGINLRLVDADTVGISLDETTTPGTSSSGSGPRSAWGHAGARSTTPRPTTAYRAARRTGELLTHPGVQPLPQRARDAALPAPPGRPGTSPSTGR